MLTLGIEYLTGYAVATDPADRDTPEWPPHPARVYMALAAACFETGESPDECEALRWLESFEVPPSIVASDADVRAPSVHYVPVNDELHASGVSLPILRRRQPRTFPRVRPHDPTLYYTWEDAALRPEQLAALDRLCGKVTRIGHSSSLVRMWAMDAPPAQSPGRLLPDEFEFDHQLRCITPGSFDELRRRFRAEDGAEYQRLTDVIASGTGKAKAQARAERRQRFNDTMPRPIRPEFRITVGYRREAPQAPPVSGSVWDPHLLVFGLQSAETTHSRLDMRASAAVARALRDAAMSKAEAARLPIPEALSGHRADGSPSESPHCAFIPLPVVGGPHADGHLVGVAVAFPKMIAADLRRQIAAIVGRVDQLTLGRLGRWRLRRAGVLSDLYNRRASTWSGPPAGCVEWATVTPVAFDEHPKAKDRAGRLEETAGMVVRACERIGLPAPQTVQVSSVSAHLGSPIAQDFPRLARKDGSLRRQAHARLRFAEPVVGPLLLGAGRYRGYGLCRPLEGQP